MSLVVGLTGGIGSGKSTVAQLFAELGIAIIDTDQLARTLTEPQQPAYTAIIEHYGTDILNPDKTLNRKKLRQIIFSDPNERLWLEQLLHPMIRLAMQAEIKAASSPYCIAVIPLLLETEPNPIIDRILVVDTEEAAQIERVSARDQQSLQEIAAILKTQVSRATRLAAANEIIYNTSTLDNLKNQVSKIHQLYLSLSKK